MSYTRFESVKTFASLLEKNHHHHHHHHQHRQLITASSKKKKKVVVPSSPVEAKGLLLASIRDKNPVIFMEPKYLYRSAVEEVPEGDYEIPLGKARVVREGSDVTVVGWGAQIHILAEACRMAEEKLNVSCELIDLRTLLPWDASTVIESVKKTGRCVVSHEAPKTCGLAAEITTTIQEKAFLYLEAPLTRVCGYDTPFPLAFERIYVPDALKNFEAIKSVIEF